MNDQSLLYNPEAEQSLLGSVIINPDIYSTINIDCDQFFIQRNGMIWKAVGNLFLKDLSIDFETICDELSRMGILENIGGPKYITELISITPTSSHADSYASIIREYSQRRRLVEIANKIANMAHDKDCILEDELVKLIDEMSKTIARADGATHWKKYLDDLYNDIIERMKNPKKIWGIPTGYRGFDKITGGLQLGEMLLFSGKPGVGKSIWAMQAAEQMAQNYPGAVYSVEMPGIQTVRRNISSRSNIEVRKIKSGEITDSELNDLMVAFERLNDLPVYMSDSSNWSTSSLRADLQHLKIRHGIKWFIFDYMMLASDGGGLGEVERTTMLSRNFKLICRQLNLSGTVIHSMRKQGMDKVQPEQQELRSSAQISYDADLICFLNEFIPAAPEDFNIMPVDQANIRTLTFGKGRELEQPKRYIHMVKRPNFPMFGDLEKE